MKQISVNKFYKSFGNYKFYTVPFLSNIISDKYFIYPHRIVFKLGFFSYEVHCYKQKKKTHNIAYWLVFNFSINTSFTSFKTSETLDFIKMFNVLI